MTRFITKKPYMLLKDGYLTPAIYTIVEQQTGRTMETFIGEENEAEARSALDAMNEGAEA